MHNSLHSKLCGIKRNCIQQARVWFGHWRQDCTGLIVATVSFVPLSRLLNYLGCLRSRYSPSHANAQARMFVVVSALTVYLRANVTGQGIL